MTSLDLIMAGMVVGVVGLGAVLFIIKAVLGIWESEDKID